MTTYRAFATTPTVTNDSDASSINVGMEFSVTATSWVTEFRYLQPTAGTGPDYSTRTGSLWTAAGVQQGASVTFPAVTSANAGQWITATLATPVQLVAGTSYRLMVRHPAGKYAATSNYFTDGTGAAGITNGPLVVPNATTALIGNGVYKYASVDAMGDASFGGANYWADVTVSDVDPAAGTNVALTGLVAALALATPVGTVVVASGGAGAVALTGLVAALTLDAPVGLAILETNIADSGAPAGIALVAPAGALSLSGTVVAPVGTLIPVTDFYHARGTVWSRAGDTDIAQGSVTVPTAPTNLGYNNLTSTGFTFSFSAPVSNGGAAVLDYSVILRQLATTIATSPNLAASPRTFAGLTQGTAYVASVRARNVAGLGAEATLAVTTPVTGSGVTNASMPYPTKSMRAYQMIYSSNASRIQSMQGTAVNVICLAFMAGSPPGVVGYTSLNSQSAFSAALIALRNTGCRVSLSFGGAGNSVDMSRAGIVNSVNSFSTNICPVDSLDVDVESGGVPSASTLKLAADDLRAGARGPNFGYTMVPPGGPPVDTFLPIAVDLHNNGYLHAYGQQFYDSPVDDGAMKYRISQAINAGLPFSKWEMGVMNPPGGGATSSYWTNDTAIARINSAKAAFGNTMKGSYYWQYDRDPGVGGVGAGDGGPLWASRISAVI